MEGPRPSGDAAGQPQPVEDGGRATECSLPPSHSAGGASGGGANASSSPSAATEDAAAKRPGAAGGSAAAKAALDPKAPTTGGPGPRKKRPQPLSFTAPKEAARPLTEQIAEACEEVASAKRAGLFSGQSSGASQPPQVGLPSSAATPRTGGPSSLATPQTSAGSASSPPALSLLSAALVSPGGDGRAELEVYEIGELQEIRKLGQGASGTVEKHRHIKTGKELAIKKIQAGDIAEPQRKAILLELRTFAKCRTPHIVDFYGAFLHENVIHIALEYMNGGALSDVLEVQCTVPEGHLANITWQVLDGLEYLHGHMHVIHRDVKPSNLLLSLQGVVKITDFGVSGELQDELAQSNKCTWVGTIYYMSPERVEGKPYKYDSDLWSLGLTMLECLTGCYPYTDTVKTAKKSLSFWELMRRVVDDEAPRLPPESGFSAELGNFLEAVLQKDRKKRPSATTMKAHQWLHSATEPDRQAAVSSWVVGSRRDKESDSKPGKPPAPPDHATSTMGGSLRGGSNPFAACGAASRDGVAAAMGASIRGGNPFGGASMSSGSAGGGGGGSSGSAAGAGSSVQDQTPAGACMGSSFRSGNSNPFAAFGASQAGAGAVNPFSASQGASSVEALRGLLQLRGAVVAGEGDLAAADLHAWEERVHRIASAYSTPRAGVQRTGGLQGLRGSASHLPCRVDSDGPGMYIGDAASARDAEALQALGIGAVMNCGAPAADYPPGFEHLLVRCEDTEGYPLLARHLDECLTFAEACEASGRGLLVHCVMGLNRSATLAVAMLMVRRGTALLESVQLVWESRGRLPILTNSSFRRQLVQIAHLLGKLG